ncbi:MAG: hypothetical protein ACRCZU_01115 [Selenomonadaceae bacterium]
MDFNCKCGASSDDALISNSEDDAIYYCESCGRVLVHAVDPKYKDVWHEPRNLSEADDILQLLEKLPNHLHLARNSEAFALDRWRLYSTVTDDYIENSRSDTAEGCLKNYLKHQKLT